MKNEPENQGPRLYPNISTLYQTLVSEMKLEGFPDTLSMHQLMIFVLGMLAGRQEEQGLWAVTEDMKLRTQLH